MGDSMCEHPEGSVAWGEWPYREVASVGGYLYGTCDLCGEHVVRTPHP